MAEPTLQLTPLKLEPLEVQDVTDEPDVHAPVPAHTTPAPQPTPQESSLLGKLVEPLWTGPSRAAKAFGDYITDPRQALFGMQETGQGGIHDFLAHKLAQTRGFTAGAAQGIGDVLSGLTSPAGLAATALGGGELFAEGAELPQVARMMNLGSRVASTPFAAHGAEQVLSPESTLQQRGQGLFELAGGVAGMMHAPPAIAEQQPQVVAPSGAINVTPRKPPVAPVTPPTEKITPEFLQSLKEAQTTQQPVQVSPTAKAALGKAQQAAAQPTITRPGGSDFAKAIKVITESEGGTRLRGMMDIGYTPQQIVDYAQALNPDAFITQPTTPAQARITKPVTAPPQPTTTVPPATTVSKVTETPPTTTQPAVTQPAVTQAGPALPRDLKGAKPAFYWGKDRYEPTFESDLDKALYIIAQDNPSKRNADYLKFVMDNTGLSDVDAVALGRRIKNAIKQTAKNTEPGTLKVPDQNVLQSDAVAQSKSTPTPVTQPATTTRPEPLAQTRIGPPQYETLAQQTPGQKFAGQVAATEPITKTPEEWAAEGVDVGPKPEQPKQVASVEHIPQPAETTPTPTEQPAPTQEPIPPTPGATQPTRTPEQAAQITADMRVARRIFTQRELRKMFDEKMTYEQIVQMAKIKSPDAFGPRTPPTLETPTETPTTPSEQIQAQPTEPLRPGETQWQRDKRLKGERKGGARGFTKKESTLTGEPTESATDIGAGEYQGRGTYREEFTEPGETQPTPAGVYDPHAQYRNDPVGTEYRISPSQMTRKKLTEALKLGFDYVDLDDAGKIIIRKVRESPSIETPESIQSSGSMIAKISNLPRTLMASLDFSAPLRQGLGLIHKKAFWTSLDDMFSAWKSEGNYKQIMDSITEDPIFQKTADAEGNLQPSFAEKAGLKLTDLNNMSTREESILSAMAEKVPGVRSSERAYTAFLNKLRADSFKQMASDFNAFSGIDAENNLPVAQKVAEFVNNASGRGSLGQLESSAKALSSVLFSPRLIASRLQMMTKGGGALFSPETYIVSSPSIRREYLKSLFAIAAVGNTFTQLMRLGGATIESNPASADFGKAKIGDTRIDPYGGFQQYIVAAERLMPQLDLSSVGLGTIGGKMKSTTTGREYSLGVGGFGKSTRADVLERFIRSKTNPIINFGWGLIAGGKEMSGKPMRLTEMNPFENAVAQRFLPMVFQDIYDLTKDSSVGIGTKTVAGTAAVFGMGTQTYGNR